MPRSKIFPSFARSTINRPLRSLPRTRVFPVTIMAVRLACARLPRSVVIARPTRIETVVQRRGSAVRNIDIPILPDQVHEALTLRHYVSGAPPVKNDD